jgi:hypothetical protein
MFGKKKIERPKNPIGLVLYYYDEILENDLKRIFDYVLMKKKINIARNEKIFKEVLLKFESFKSDISKEKLKVDYRSDKARDLIIDMINKTTEIIDLLQDRDRSNLYVDEDLINKMVLLNEDIHQQRALISKKLKDVECDYV